MTAEHVLVVGTGRDLAVRMRARTGVRTTTLVRLPSLARLRQVAENERVVALPAADVGEWVAHARFVHSRDPVHRVAAFSELDQDKAAAVAEALGLPFHSARTVRAVTDKLTMRRTLAGAGVEDVGCTPVSDVRELAGLVERWGALVLKPVDGAGSSRVSLVRSADDVPAAWRWSATDDRSPLIAEEYLRGEEFSVEGFSEDGEHEIVAITRKFTDGRHFVEIGHQVPAGLPEEVDRGVRRHVTAVLDALGVRDGPSHTEVVLTTAGPRTVETHVRLGGDFIPDLVLDATGVDLFDLTARQAAGERVMAELRGGLADRRATATAAIWFLGAEADGVLSGADGTDAARQHPGVVDVQLTKTVGERVTGPELTDSSGRVLFCRAVHEDPAMAVTIAREGAEKVVLVTTAV